MTDPSSSLPPLFASQDSIATPENEQHHHTTMPYYQHHQQQEQEEEAAAAQHRQHLGVLAGQQDSSLMVSSAMDSSEARQSYYNSNRLLGIDTARFVQQQQYQQQHQQQQQYQQQYQQQQQQEEPREGQKMSMGMGRENMGGYSASGDNVAGMNHFAAPTQMMPYHYQTYQAGGHFPSTSAPYAYNAPSSYQQQPQQQQPQQQQPQQQQPQQQQPQQQHPMYGMNQTPASFSRLPYQGYSGYPSHYSSHPAAQEKTQSQRYSELNSGASTGVNHSTDGYQPVGASRMPSAAEDINSAAASRQRMGLLQEAHSSKRHIDQKESASKSSSSMRRAPMNGRTITPEQLYCLKMQVHVFNCITRGERIRPEILKALKPPPLHTSLLSRDNGKLEASGLPFQDMRTAQLDYGRGPQKPEYAGAHASSMYPMTKPATNQASMKASAQEQRNASYLQQEERHPADPGPRILHPSALSKSKGILERKPPSPTVRQVRESPRHYPLFVSERCLGPRAFGAERKPAIESKWNFEALMARERERIFRRIRCRRIREIEKCLERRSVAPSDHALLAKEKKMLSLTRLQANVRKQVVQCHKEVMQLSDKDYKKFVRDAQRSETRELERLLSHVKQNRKRLVDAIFINRRNVRDTETNNRNLRETRNKGVSKTHEKFSRDWTKMKTEKEREERAARLEALKANDVEAYKHLLLSQKPVSGNLDASEAMALLQDFLAQTEEYLRDVGGKVATIKLEQEAAEAAARASSEARERGLSEEDCLLEAETASRLVTETRISEEEARLQKESDKVGSYNYYAIAHSEKSRIVSQPAMLKLGKLREYQLVGLQWMVSLYKNRLNGILADEMGLGKTVQVLALIAYLMENEKNRGPHIIIVPNAVVINWKNEIKRWLGDDIKALIYVGNQDERKNLWSNDVTDVRFNILVTSYEFVMRDRARLSRIQWRYLVIDEAQRMKDRQSRLSQDLDRFSAERRLLLTGTPLQNDIMELWSLLNLLLPGVFDSSNQFASWFASAYDTPSSGGGKKSTGEAEDSSSNPKANDEFLEQEKKVIVISRLHQIMEPFMLRRMVEDVESKLPPKVSFTLHTPMSALQSAVYNWVDVTSSRRLHPLEESVGGKTYAPLQNRVMELRKVCNHPYLCYSSGGQQPLLLGHFNDGLVRQAGKLYILDKMFVKLRASSHRVLVFSTMTRVLDMLQDYLTWRFGSTCWLRIDGSTSLDERESAISIFNSPESETFVFLLSIKAAGRGLNLQTADTVVIYDPDPNPKNEEQAVARAHRLGQTKEVRVYYMEAVRRSYEKENDNDNNEGKAGESSKENESQLEDGAEKSNADAEESASVTPSETKVESNESEAHGPEVETFRPSVETIVRTQIQKHKLDLADEVINAGRFDNQTTAEERRKNLEELLQEDSQDMATTLTVPSEAELNSMLARSPEELVLFEKLDSIPELWPKELLTPREVPEWLQPKAKEYADVIENMKDDRSKRHAENAQALFNSIALEESARASSMANGNEDEGADDIPNESSAEVPFEAVEIEAIGSSTSFDPREAERLAYEICDLRKMMSKDENELCKKAMVEILNALEVKTLRPLAQPFRYLVSKKEFPTYYEIVENPICLDMIDDNFSRGKYQSPSELRAALELMKKNAIAFNGAEHILVKDAEEFLKRFDTVMSKEPPYWPPIDSLPPEEENPNPRIEPKSEPKQKSHKKRQLADFEELDMSDTDEIRSRKEKKKKKRLATSSLTGNPMDSSPAMPMTVNSDMPEEQARGTGFKHPSETRKAKKADSESHSKPTSAPKSFKRKRPDASLSQPPPLPPQPSPSLPPKPPPLPSQTSAPLPPQPPSSTPHPPLFPRLSSTPQLSPLPPPAPPPSIPLQKAEVCKEDNYEFSNVPNSKLVGIDTPEPDVPSHFSIGPVVEDMVPTMDAMTDSILDVNGGEYQSGLVTEEPTTAVAVSPVTFSQPTGPSQGDKLE